MKPRDITIDVNEVDGSTEIEFAMFGFVVTVAALGQEILDSGGYEHATPEQCEAIDAEILRLVAKHGAKKASR